MDKIAEKTKKSVTLSYTHHSFTLKLVTPKILDEKKICTFFHS